MLLKLLLVLAAFVQLSLACSPGPDWPPPFEDSFESASSIFVGTVAEIQNYENEFDQGFCVNVTLTVLTTFKGDTIRGDSVTVSTASNSALCGFTFTDSETYVVWTSPASDLCGTSEQVDGLGRSKVISNAEEDLALLEEATADERDEGVCLYTKSCCVEDCCGKGTSWDSQVQKCVLDLSSEGWTGEYSDDYNPNCDPQYACCESDCCNDAQGTYWDGFIAYCMPSESAMSRCGARPSAPNYLCQDGVTMAGPGDCTEESGIYRWEFVQCPECASDDDCAGETFCSKGECRAAGTCAELNDCLNPANVYPTDDCIGYLQCEAGQCGMQCPDRLCPPDLEPAECFSSACAVSRCGNPSVSCVDYYCGGCNAIFFDAAGNVACGPDITDPQPECELADCGPPPPGAPFLCPDGVTVTGYGSVCEWDFQAGACVWGALPCPSCDANKDCGEGQFCAKGVCRAHGSCEDALDCTNPSNEYISIECVGLVTCFDEQCGIDCNEPPCPNDDQVECLGFANPCEVSTCPDGFSCVDNYCGGCNAIHFDTAGNQICDEEKLPKCNSGEDCGEDQYCSRGYCRNIGMCEDTLDCQNPENDFDETDCDGYVQCGSDNGCEKVCGTTCPGGETLGCDFAPCAAATCVSPSSCVDDFCICEAIFFDPSGNVAC